MGSQFPHEVQELLWKLHWCREQAVKLGFDTAGLLIRSAATEVEDIARQHQENAAAKIGPPAGDDQRA